MTSPAVVLVVEDDPLVLMSAADIIEDAGYQTLQPTNADDALAFLERRRAIRMVFADVDMPGSMNGLKLATSIRERRSTIEIIVTSGRGLASEAILPPRGVFLSKPYRSSVLIAHLRAMI